MNRSLWSQAFRYYLRFLLQVPASYRPDGSPHVFLFSTRRSGSTLLRDAIGSVPGFNYIDQPFDCWLFNPHADSLPHYDGCQVTSASADQFSQLKRYLDDLLARRKILRSRWQFWRQKTPFFWSRYVVKIVNAKALISRLERAYRNKAIIAFLVRHPVPTAMSILQRGWGLTAQSYLSDERFVDSYLTEKMVERSWQVLRGRDLFEKHVLNWCLENLVPLRLWREADWFRVSFEAMVTEPSRTTRRLLGFVGADSQLASVVEGTLARPTRTASKQSAAAIRAQGARSRTESWQQTIGQKALGRVQSLLELFEVDLYDAGSPFPDDAFDR